MIYDDIVEAQRKRDVKAAIMSGAKQESCKQQNPEADEQKESHAEELKHDRREIKALGLKKYCSVLQF